MKVIKTYYLINFGCKVNHFEINAVSNDLTAYGLKQIKKLEKADVIIINTCSVTNKADAKSRSAIVKAQKVANHPIIIVMGCYSQTSTNWFSDHQVDIVIGNTNKSKVVELLKQFLSTNQPINQVEDILKIKQFEKMNSRSFCDNTRAFLKIQDGCNYFCSYCIIPYARGLQRSKNHQEVIDDIKCLVNSGFKEIVLSGVNTSGYLDGDVTFFQLLKMINVLDGNFRVRISSLEPFLISHEIIDLIASNPKRWCRHLHLCLQTASDKVLKAMNRKYTINEFKNLVDYIRKAMPDCAITTDYIVGFLTETYEDFQESLENLGEISFSDMHIFSFSLRQHTQACNLKNVVSSEQKKQRQAEIIKFSENCKQKFLNSFLDKSVEVLVETRGNNINKTGHSSQFFVVNFTSKKNL